MAILTDQTIVQEDTRMSKDSILLPEAVVADNGVDGAIESIGVQRIMTAVGSYKAVEPGSPRSPKSLKERQQSRKAKYDRKCASCKKRFKGKTQPTLSKKMILRLKETFAKCSQATWKKVERELLTFDSNDSKVDDAVIENHYNVPPYDAKTLNAHKTPAEMRRGLQNHFSQLLFPGALARGETAQVPWTSLGQWLEVNQKRLVNWPTGVRFPDSSYQMVGFWNLTEVNALYGVRIVNWTQSEKNIFMPATPLVFNQMGQSVVSISQIEQLTYGASSVDSSSDILYDSDEDMKKQLIRGERRRLSIQDCT